MREKKFAPAKWLRECLTMRVISIFFILFVFFLFYHIHTRFISLGTHLQPQQTDLSIRFFFKSPQI